MPIVDRSTSRVTMKLKKSIQQSCRCRNQIFNISVMRESYFTFSHGVTIALEHEEANATKKAERRRRFRGGLLGPPKATQARGLARRQSRRARNIRAATP